MQSSRGHAFDPPVWPMARFGFRLLDRRDTVGCSLKIYLVCPFGGVLGDATVLAFFFSNSILFGV